MIQTYQSNLENFIHWAHNTPNNIYLKQPQAGNYKEYTYQESLQIVEQIGSYLNEQLSDEKPKHIGILAKNSAHWILSDLAISYAGAVSVPFYATLTSEQLNQVLVHSDCQILIVGKLDNWDEIQKGIPDSIQLIFTPDSPCQKGIAWTEILTTTLKKLATALPQKDALATIIYTSGTTGVPKGVMITNGSIAQALNLARKIAYLDKPNTRFISYLPLCHIAERNFVEFACTAAGGTIYFVENLDTFQQNLAHARPSHFLAVPRIWAKFKEGILQKIGGQKKLSLLLAIPVIKKIIQKKIQKGLGLDQTCMVVTGAAPMPQELTAWFQTIGLYIQEAYGMTENMGLNSLTPRHKIKLGTVGRVHDQCTTRIDPETGEIQMKANYNCLGYYKNKEQTEALFDGPWLKTGDMGQLDSENYLSIVGRVKDNFKTAKGQYVSPAPIENALSLHEYVEVACVVGVNLPQPLGLVQLSPQALNLSKQELTESLHQLLTDINPMFKKYEYLKKLIILQEPWTVENACLTPTLKIRRMQIEKNVETRMEEWYHDKPTIIFE
ncbi:AMP-binding protein [Aquirufa regiilacus]|uniref:AMP-binding protein n=1 Tax=Aquirufa regiilacus TaxID=3024868 RepID=A0ABU3TRW7_9BACT|nr:MULTISPECIES: AMP-binding protein [unclassified Aquirufa]MDT8888089.1 AMP-binding protein [Aquirufa sp. LEPPI-3A]MDU0808569.1 AMP-binding protein [Aquirufa sp. LEOWEIH-7C]